MWSSALFCLVMVAQVMCKVSLPKIENLIYEGTNATEGSFPYQVVITSVRGNQRSICGGAIIGKKYILTAAHCVDDEFISNTSSVTVRAGTIDRTKGIELSIKKAVRYPEYSESNDENDVAVLETVSDIEETDNIKAIDLPSQGRAVTGEVTVSGWGRTQANTGFPINLMSVNLTVVEDDKCTESYGSTFTKNMFCAGNYLQGGPGACVGDSGGPAVQDGLIVGVVSFGRKCGGRLYPTVFMDVAAKDIREFIKKNTGL